MLVANFCAEMALSGLDVCLLVDDDNLAGAAGIRKGGLPPAGAFTAPPIFADYSR